MNFKNITKIAAALLFIGIPAFAMEMEKGPVYLHIQNNTAYDLNISQSTRGISPSLGAIAAGTLQVFSQLPWTYELPNVKSAAFFSLEDSSRTVAFRPELEIDETPEAIKASASLSELAIGDIDKFQNDIKSDDNEYHIYVTLAGNKENKFAGSSIKVEAKLATAGIPEFVQGLVYLRIQNNTDYSFSIYQEREPYQYESLESAAPHSLNNIDELPWSDLKGTRFDLKYRSIQLTLAAHHPDESTYNASLTSFTRQGEAVVAKNKIEKTISGINNDLYIFLTLEGKEENNFTGSSIKLELKVITPKMKRERERVRLEKEKLQIAASRFEQEKQRLQKEQRETIMDIINELAPSLYKEIEAVDPSGANHIILSDEWEELDNARANVAGDGLPLITVGSVAAQDPRKELKYTIAHELGHYVLDHFEESASSEQILKHAFSRSQESEADKFAIMELGADIDAAIASYKKQAEKPKGGVSSETFKRTHLLELARIQYFEELRREKEAQRRKPEAINWKELADHYLKKYRIK